MKIRPLKVLKNHYLMKILDLDSKFQKPYPQSGGVEFGVEFLLDCKPPRGVPEPTSKFLLKSFLKPQPNAWPHKNRRFKSQGHLG